jgi:hypothetical protein
LLRRAFARARAMAGGDNQGNALRARTHGGKGPGRRSVVKRRLLLHLRKLLPCPTVT